MSGGAGPRLFIAAEAPLTFRSAFDSVRPDLASALPQARWARSEGIHLTLKFLGSTTEQAVLATAGTLARLAGGRRPFELVTGEPGLFESRGRARVLWVALDGDLEEATRLRVDIESAAEALGFVREGRPFHPHLTLARFDSGRRTVVPPQILTAVRGALGGIPVSVGSLILFESVLSPAGSKYVVRGSFPLLGGRS